MKLTIASFLGSIVGLTTLLGSAGPSLAVPVFDVRVETCCLPSSVLQQETSDSFVFTATNNDNFAIPLGNGSVGAVALAGPGRLGAGSSGTVSVTNVSNSAGSLDSTGTARFILDDIILSGPESTVNFTLNLHLSGIRALHTSNSSVVDPLVGPFGGEARAESYVRLSGNLSFLPHDPEVPHFGGTLDRTQISNLGCDVAGCWVTTENSTGIFNGFAGDATAITPTFNAPVGNFFSLDMDLYARSFVSYGNRPGDANMFASSSTNFANTVSFPTAGPVFNLPAGYTANSVSGLIVNNQWTGGPVAAVPEPSSLILLCSGLVGLVLWRRKRAA